jgi:diguanylate cyclase (GGDEF)-like protein/PAS domain S-box-containing protein
MPHLLPAGLLSRLIEESQDAVLVIDDQSTIRYLNPAAGVLTGYPISDLLGQPLSKLLPGPIAADHHGIVRRFVTYQPPSRVLGHVREFTVLHRDGEQIPIELKAVDLGLAEGTRYFGAFMTDVRERRRMEAENAELLARLQRQALSDALTGLPNRRAFQAQAQQLAARVKRAGEPATLAIADLDHFKSINDRYGHLAGDGVLTAIGAIIHKAARAGDIIGRIGGEEFGMLFPATPPDAARDVAERIRAAVEQAVVQITPDSSLSITISIGLAPLAGELKSAMAQADAALYRAKRAGRNRVELHTQ